MAGAALLAVAWMSAARAGPPFQTDDPDPIDYRHWEIIGFSLGTVARGSSGGVLPATEINYGALPDLHLHLQFGAAYADQPGTGRRLGYGDTQIGVKYRFVDADAADWWPEIAAYPQLDFGTGNAARGLGTGRDHLFLPLWIQKAFGPWTTYGGGGYWINPGPGNRDYWFAGWQAQRQLTEHLVLGAEIFHQSASAIGGPRGTGTVVGQQGTTGFNVGGMRDLNDHFQVLFTAGRGIENVAVTNRFTYYIGLRWTD